MCYECKKALEELENDILETAKSQERVLSIIKSDKQTGSGWIEYLEHIKIRKEILEKHKEKLNTICREEDKNT